MRKRDMHLDIIEKSRPVPKVQCQSVLIQNNFREILWFSTDSEGFQNQLWSDFWIYLNHSKIQRKYSVFFWNKI